MNIEFRKLHPKESRIYREIRLESLEKFSKSFGANYKEALEIKKFKLEIDIEERTIGRFVIGAFAYNVLIGIGAFVIGENNSGNICQMYVKERFQGKNIGFGLIQEIITEVNKKFGDIEIYLEVTENNSKAYNLYKRFGFKKVVNDTAKKENGTNILMKYSKKYIL